ncbi:MAG: hypothetical protein IKQ55_12635 [Kiritimatiellae bacterium]|nr:hypothetical protein [Kiritimatiellia bacterium]
MEAGETAVAVASAAAGALPGKLDRKTLLNVDYDHYKLADGGDLYVTRYGRPFLAHLVPDRWYEKEWFRKSREKLCGTSRVYKVQTKPVDGHSKALVVKWCRVGETVPVDTFTLNKFIEAEFNSPYEEFSLLMEMRARTRPGVIRTHKPLAIYVPAKRLELWQTGRSQSKMAQKKAKFRDVELDINRQYILIYEWIKGVASTDPAAAEAAARTPPPPPEEDALPAGAPRLPPPAFSFAPPVPFPTAMLRRSIRDMWQTGFRVLDVKPEHVIVRPLPDGTLLRGRDGLPAYALVDFELLARTPGYEDAVKRSRRQDYLERQRDRFAQAPAFPEHLHSVNIFGVDYVHGDCGSTNGKLWVVGRDPLLFDYFQPERWRRTPRESLSDTQQVYSTTTKDEIHLVWKVSHVGDRPEPEESTPAHMAYGYNSPFEEFAFAMRLAAAGVPTTYPRAIYMLGNQSTLPPEILDPRRYLTHAGILMPDGEPVLQRSRNYIVIWGYWNGLDEVLASAGAADGVAGNAEKPAPFCRGVNAARALEQGLIDAAMHDRLMDKMARLLASAGFESTMPRDTHFLLTLLPDGTLQLDPDGTPVLRVCNFEFLRPLDG